ncbi:MAG: tetratricopeptide repeat protein [Nitrospinae bacterium]|nr:tetratricopeptide repeat protein [Nitrospinota bacterium]
MTTIILVIVALAVVAGIISKTSKKKSSKKKASSGDSADSGKPKLRDPNHVKKAQAMVQKAIQLSPEMGVGDINLYLPPPEPELFIGRKEIIKDVLARTGKPPVMISFSGPQGVGKTTLAVMMIKRLASQFPGDQVFMDMRGSDPKAPTPTEIMSRIITRFKPLQPLPTDLKSLTKLYRTILKRQKGVLILDNAAGPKQIKPLIPPPSWLLITTSVKPVGLPGFVGIKLETLDFLDSHNMLTRLCPKLSHAIKEISKICKDVPIALELIGKLFAINATMDPEYFANKFRDVKKGLGHGDNETIATGIESSLKYSYTLLPDKAATVLRKLTVFPGSFNAKAESFVCEDTDNLSLVGLVQYGLVETNEKTDRFYLHDLVRKYVKPLISAGEQGMAERRLATEFMNALETVAKLNSKGGKPQIKGMMYFDQELDNIKAGQEWSQRNCSKDKDAAKVCSAYTENGAEIIVKRLQPTETIRWFEAALSAAQQLGDKEAERMHLLNLGPEYNRLNQPQKAMEFMERALSLCKKEGDHQGEKVALKHLGVACFALKNYKRAVEFLEQDLKFTQAAGEKADEMDILEKLGTANNQIGDFQKAIEYGDQAFEMAQQSGDKLKQVHLLNMLGEACLGQEEMEKALDYFENSLDLTQKTKERPLETELIKKLSDLAVNSGDKAKALAYLESGLSSAQKSQNVQGEGKILMELGTIHQEDNSHDQAAIYFEDALALSIKSENKELEGDALWRISISLGSQDRFIEASERANEALKIYEEIKHPDLMAVRTQIRKWSSGETPPMPDNANSSS